MLSRRFNVDSIDKSDNVVKEETENEDSNHSIDESLNGESEGLCTIAAIKDSLILRRKKINQHCISHKQINTICTKLPPIAAKSKKETMENMIKGLPSDWVVNDQKSKVIHRLLRKKEAEHESTLDAMREKMANVNATIEDEIRLLGNIHKESFENLLKNMDESLSNLRAAYHDEKYLKQKHFDKAVEGLMENYDIESEKIFVLIEKLRLSENQRIEQFKTFLQVAYLRLNEICFKTPFEIQEFFVQEIQDVNEITLNNLRSYQSLNLKLCLNLENETRLRLQEIELIKLNWINYIKLSAFTTLNEQNLFGELFEATKSKYRLDPRIIDLLKKTKLNDLNLGDLHDWINRVQIILQQIDWCAKDIIKSFRTAIQTVFKSYFSDMKRIAEKILKLGVVGNNPRTEDIFTPEIYCPSIADMDRKFQKMLQKLQSMWDSISGGLHKELQLTFMFLNTFANLWEAHVIRMNEAQNLVVKDVQKCTNNGYLDLSNEEANINVSLDILRQEPNEEDLDINVAKINKNLDTIKQLYKANCDKESQVIEDKIMYLVTVEGDLHKAELVNFLTLNEEFRAKEEEEEEEQIEEFDRISVMQSELDIYENEFMDIKAWRSQLYSTIESYLDYCDDECAKSAKNWIEQEREKFNLRKTIAQTIIHKSRYNRIKPILYDIRLAELKEHTQRFESHKAGVVKQIENFSGFFLNYQDNYDKEVDEFTERSNNIELKLPEAKNCPDILGEIVVYNVLAERCDKTLRKLNETFHTKCDEYVGTILKSNFNYINSMKTFHDGGNFNPEEVKTAAAALSKIEKGIKRKLKVVSKQSSGKLQKCLAKVTSIQTTTSNILEQYRIELEYYDITVNTHKDVHADIAREAYLLKCHRKSVFGLIDQVKEKSQHFAKDQTRIHEFRRLIRVMIKEIVELRKRFERPYEEDDGRFIHLNPPICSEQVFDFEPYEEEESFLRKCQFLVQNAFNTVQEASKIFYQQNSSPFVTEDKILPSYEDFIATNLPKCIYYYVQCELFWIEELELVLKKLKETGVYIRLITKRMLDEYKNKTTKEIKDIHRLFVKRLGEVNFKQTDIFEKIHRRLLALHGNPNNQNLLDQLDGEMNKFLEEWKNIFLPSLEFCTCDLKDMQITFRTTLEELLYLSTEAVNQFTEEINLTQLQEEYSKCSEFLETFGREKVVVQETSKSKPKSYNSKNKSEPTKASINLNVFREKIEKKCKFNSFSINSITSEFEDEDLIDVGAAVNAYEVERLYILLALQSGDNDNVERLERWKAQWVNEIEKVKQLYTVKYDLTQNSEDQ